MLGSLSPFFVAIYSICMLNADLYVHNYIAFLFVIVGSFLTALSGVIDFTGGTKISPITNPLEYAGMMIILFASLWFAAL